MAINRQFKNPPIREAIFAVYFKESVLSEDLNKFLEHSYIKNLKHRVNLGYRVQVKNQGGDPIETSKIQEGYSLIFGVEDSKVIQVMPTHISYHNFNKETGAGRDTVYSGWETMFGEFQDILNVFCEMVGKFEAARVSVRYINQIVLPIEAEINFQDYVKLFPAVPDEIPQISNFFVQINVDHPDDNKVSGIISETILIKTSPAADTFKLLLDITVQKQDVFDIEGNTFLENFSIIRSFKNELFNSCLTEKTLNRFN